MTPEHTALVATVERVAGEQKLYRTETIAELKAAAALMREQAGEIERLKAAPPPAKLAADELRRMADDKVYSPTSFALHVAADNLEHWAGRASRAEAECDTLRAEVAKLRALLDGAYI